MFLQEIIALNFCSRDSVEILNSEYQCSASLVLSALLRFLRLLRKKMIKISDGKLIDLNLFQ